MGVGEARSDIRERPDVVGGVTQRINTGWGKVYVIINDGPDGEPLEVFVNTGKSGGLYNAQAEAIGLVVSRAMRSGTDPRALAEDLAGIRSGKTAVDNGDLVRSIADAVGIAMLRHLDDGVGEPVRGDAGPGDGPGDEGPEGPL